MTDYYFPSRAKLDQLAAENLERQRRFNVMHERRAKREAALREEQRREKHLDSLPAFITDGARTNV